MNARPLRSYRTAMTALRSLAFNVAFYVNLIVLMIVGLPLVLIGRHGVFFMARLWSRNSLWLLEKICGLRVEFRGVENIPQGGYILAAKHQSFLETFALLLHAHDFAIIFKRQLAWVPLFGNRAHVEWYGQRSHAIQLEQRKRNKVQLPLYPGKG